MCRPEILVIISEGNKIGIGNFHMATSLIKLSSIKHYTPPLQADIHSLYPKPHFSQLRSPLDCRNNMSEIIRQHPSRWPIFSRREILPKMPILLYHFRSCECCGMRLRASPAKRGLLLCNMSTHVIVKPYFSVSLIAESLVRSIIKGAFIPG